MRSKVCERCHIEKDLTQFRKVTNQYTGVHPMSICKACYTSNQQVRRQQEEAVRLERAAILVEQRGREERARHLEQERLVRQHIEEAWYRQQPDRRCVDCKRVLAASAFGYSLMKEVDGVPLPVLHQRCRDCHEAYRVRGQPLCLLCRAHTQPGSFLHEYKSYRLDIIRICCENCIPRFEVLSEQEQLALLHRAMVNTYGQKAVIYALQYDDRFPCHHIGRTKHYAKRMAQYERNWYTEIRRHFILQELSFGPLSMEYESRWMMHALKYGWPIDNFALLKGGEDGRSGERQQTQLIEAVQAFEPLTAPFERVWPLIRASFLNTLDAEIVNWYCSRYHRNAYPGEDEMRQRIVLLQRLHGLRS